MGSNPAFGLNALGGAISIGLKDGFSAPGGEADLSGGSFGRRQGSLQYGGEAEVLGGAFRLAIDSATPGFRLVEMAVRARVRLFALPYGDQAIFARRQAYEAVGRLSWPGLHHRSDIGSMRESPR